MFKIEERMIDKETELARFQVSQADGIYRQLCIDVYTIHQKIKLDRRDPDFEYIVFFDSAPTRKKNLKKEDYITWAHQITDDEIRAAKKSHYEKSDDYLPVSQIIANYALGDYQYYLETGDKSIFKL